MNLAGSRKSVHPVAAVPSVGVSLARPSIERVDHADGSFVLRATEQLQPYDRCIGDWLEYWAHEDGNRTFLSERAGAGWRSLSYADTLEAVRSVAQALLNLGVESDRPVVALSDNSINLAILSLAAMHVGRRISVVSSAYSRMASNHTKLHAILDRIQPGLLYAEDASQYSAAIAAWQPRCPVVYAEGAELSGALSFSSLLSARPGPQVDAAFLAVTGDTVARLLLTSGSTGMPKLVPNTHAMLCANQQMIAQCWHFIDMAQPVVLDWLPWSHTFGANHNFNLILRNGGTLYIDRGRPAPGAIESTIRALREIRPTLFFNVPRGYDMVLPHLEEDDVLAAALFDRLDMLLCAGAALPQLTAERLRAVASRVRAAPLFLTTEWGSTETSPVITSAHFHTTNTRNIGVPVPGVELKFVPCQDKYELRVRGPSVFPGYQDDAARTREAFDDEGFYSMGDAGKLADPDDPNSGVIFDGRVSEDFKLTTGTWVSVGTLRINAVSVMSPYAQDVVVTGHDRDEVGLLIFPTPELRALANDTESGMSGKLLGQDPAVRAVLAEALSLLGRGAGSSQRAAAAVLLSEPPSIERGEITDKGYVNQRAVLTLRADDVERLYSGCPSVIRPS
ncbi:feruloyl-CoA synthase [Burkholderia sp. Bp9140]|nr:feruloyl-CoA synthase [Burkholderia sp. Bp9140]